MNVKIIYWPKSGSVEKVAKKIADKLNNANVFSVENIDYNMLADTELLILGGSTVGADDWKNSNYKDAWSKFFNELNQKGLSLKNKKVAIFGLGNQVLYPEHFVDSMKDMADYVEATGASIVGASENKGYHFTASEALKDGKFIGLAIDEDTQASKTDARIDAWIADLGL